MSTLASSVQGGVYKSAPAPASLVPGATPPLSHPTPCPSWCRHRFRPLGHHFGPSSTAHFSLQQVLANPDPLPGDLPVLLRAEVTRLDEGGELGEPVMFVQGETDIELDAAGADMLIADMEAFVAKLRVLRGQMDV
ncbi:DUF6907 domain-containing protein [Streptantibioticus silvisoli]|uniref:Uncharacterized protein n=1 Tax=Streptantibioticus silvisoli TaxID=2705255 RepID=A0ABT6W512_9ACTN|nr:hypothetical protein [Streptantibioticus silvisoli]MDI5965769.1 hypothetical protein [Streptantibioticus silvisoli]